MLLTLHKLLIIVVYIIRTFLGLVIGILLHTELATQLYAQQTAWRRMGHFSPIEYAGPIGDNNTLISISRPQNVRVLFTDPRTEEVITQWGGLPSFVEPEPTWGYIAHSASSILNKAAALSTSPILAASFTTVHTYYDSWHDLSPEHQQTYELAFWNYQTGQLDTIAGFKEAIVKLRYLDYDRLLIVYRNAIWNIDISTKTHTKIVQNARLATVMGDSVIVAHDNESFTFFSADGFSQIDEITVKLDSQLIATPVLGNTKLAFTSGRDIKLLDITTHDVLDLSFGDSIVALEYNEQSKTLIASGVSGSLRSWVLPDLTPSIYNGVGVTTAIAFDDGFITGTKIGYVFNVTHGGVKDTLSHLFGTSHTAVTYDDHVYTYHSGGLLRVFNSNGETVREQMFPEPHGYLSPKATRLVCLEDGTTSRLRVRNLRTSALEVDRSIGWWFVFLGFSPDEREIAYRYRYDFDSVVYVYNIPAKLDRQYVDTLFKREVHPEADRAFFDSTRRVILALSGWGKALNATIDREDKSVTKVGTVGFDRGVDYSPTRNELALTASNSLRLLNLDNSEVREELPFVSNVTQQPTRVRYTNDERGIFFGFNDTIAFLDLETMTWRYPYGKVDHYNTLVGQLADQGLVTLGQMLVKFNPARLLDVKHPENLPLVLTPYPNPSSRLLTIEGCSERARIEIIDIHGREVIQPIDAQRIDVSGLLAGCYYIKVCEPNGPCSIVSFVKI